MTKLGPINFDDAVLDAIRDDRLVVFAGAGVSMGAPSNLASFWELTKRVARGTGRTPADNEPLDRFLGALQHGRVDVHTRAAALLSPPGSLPNELHRDLLRLFRTVDRVRLVTTNFDLHFQNAAKEVFGDVPTVYRAPALPLGHDFSGIVHVHGCLPAARSLVLTDSDFGRAYLTEGWARRFLVDAFGKYTVLFVGYSHTDTAMHYLARALPAERDAGRFALTDEDGSWSVLGITPIRFAKGEFTALYDGVRRLAERVTRGPIEWQSRLAELGSRVPPIDEDAVNEIEQALREVHTTRFLLDVARGPEWLRWLTTRRYLDALFKERELEQRDVLLVGWVAQHFTVEYPDELLDLLAQHELRMNSLVWSSLVRHLAFTKEPVAETNLRRWVSVLLASVPSSEHREELQWLVTLCGERGQVDLALGVFMVMSKPRLVLKAVPARPYSDDADGHRQPTANCSLSSGRSSLNEVWLTHLKPHLPEIAQPLLSGITRWLDEMYSELASWGRASRERDPLSYRRAAIERHAQDLYPEAVDVLIDAARDALECLATTSPVLLAAWTERLVVSDAPLLRRLAIHAATLDPQQSAEARLAWLLDRVGLGGLAEHHEVHRAVAQNYASASEQVRQGLIEAVRALAQPAFLDLSAETTTAHVHFNWFSWLLQSKPDCSLAQAALAPIKASHADWQPSEHPDFTRWTGPAEWVDTESPWSTGQLLARGASEQIEELLNFKGDRFYEPSRDGLLSQVREACKQNVDWAFSLVRALTERRAWVSDLWPTLILGLLESSLTIDGWRQLLGALSRQELQTAHPYEIANLLEALVRDGGKPFAIELLNEANAVALPIWQGLGRTHEHDVEVDDWLSYAVNRSAGVIVSFWLNSLSLLVHEKNGPDRVMPDSYREWFTMVVRDETWNGGMGRSLLASQAAFLFDLDEAWAREYIIPLFSDPDPQKFNQAWDGFFTWGHLTTLLAYALMPAFLGVLARRAELGDKHERFIEYYTSLAVFYVPDPTQQLIPALFKHGTLEDRVSFASRFGYFLRHIAPADRMRHWDGWLRRYWTDRLHGVPAVLDDEEACEMLNWLPNLGDAFPEAVELAVQSRQVQTVPSSLPYRLSESELVTQFQNAAAELLIYVIEGSRGYGAVHLAAIDARLTDISEHLRQRIDEAFAQAGMLKRTGVIGDS